MSDADQKMIEALMAKNKELQAENDRLKQQQNTSSNQAAPAPVEQKATNLTATDVSGKVSQGIADSYVANLTDEDGEPIKGEKVTFMVGNKVAGSAITDANGDATLRSKQYAGDPQAWAQGLSGGYTAVFKGGKNYKPSTANAGAGVSI